MGDLPLIAYEAGQHVWDRGAVATSSDPRMYDLYMQYFDLLSGYIEVMMHFNLNDPWRDPGAWGAVNLDFNHDSPKIRAIRDWSAQNL